MKQKQKQLPSHLEQDFDRRWIVARGPELRKELKFMRWRFDRACPDAMVAIELDGGIGMIGGGHTGRKGYQKDRIKDFEAAMAGWVVIRLTGKMLLGMNDGWETLRRLSEFIRERRVIKELFSEP